MAFICDPIIECNLNVGTVFSAPLQGKEVEWEIIERMKGEYDVIIARASVEGKEVIRNYTVNQFGYLMSVKKIFHFVRVVL